MGGFGFAALFLIAYLVISQFGKVSTEASGVASAGTLELARGTIADRAGFPLALDVFTYDIEASPAQLGRSDRDALAKDLSEILRIPYEQLRPKLDTTNSYVSLAEGQSAEIAAAVMKLTAKPKRPVNAVAHPSRHYPEGTLACHVLGFVNQRPGGCYGVEEYYQQDLERREIRIEELGFASLEKVQTAGTTLRLTIDRFAQQVAEAELEAGVRQTRATGGQVIVLLAKTSEVLAMASWPVYNPKEFWEVPQSTWGNPAISEAYEPGSVFKVVTYAAALDSGTIKPTDWFNDPGMIEVGGRKIYNWDRARHGSVDVVGALGNSLNVVAADITQRMGRNTFYTYVRRFGFGQLSEVDMAGESPGLLKTPNDPTWSDSDLGTNSFGQGISVTPLQMINAVASIANDGMLMSPQVVQQKTVGGQVLEMRPRNIRRTVSPETARTMTDLLVQMVDEYMPEARVPGYSIAGKTGTAEIPIGGAYHPTDCIVSFVGYGPATNPELIILVKLDRPQTVKTGREAAVPVFRKIATQLFKYLAIQPDRKN